MRTMGPEPGTVGPVTATLRRVEVGNPTMRHVAAVREMLMMRQLFLLLDQMQEGAKEKTMQDHRECSQMD